MMLPIPYSAAIRRLYPLAVAIRHNTIAQTEGANNSTMMMSNT